MSYNFDNRHFVVTGGAGALGSAVVQLLIDSGASCSVPRLSESKKDDFALSEHPRVFFRSGVDLSDEGQAQSFYDDAIRARGDLWGSIHIAGGFGMGRIEDTPFADFNKQIQMNTSTCYNSCRAAVQAMQASDYPGGRIVNIAARPAVEPSRGKGMTAYTVSKAGVAALTESLAAEVIDDNILVNAVAPSAIDTPQNREDMPDADFDNWLKPKKLARQIAHLADPENEVVRGAVIPAYG